MLRLVEEQRTNTGITARILGPKGMVELRDLVWIADRADILELYYWQAQAVLAGAYHCCFSLPGKVLRIEHEPRQ
jgi:hypothetical protein